MGCSKHKGAIIKGRAIENGTENPISNIKLSVIHGYKDKNGAHKTEILATTVTDGEGNFELAYHRKLFNLYELQWRSEHQEYAPWIGTEYVSGQKMNYSIRLFPFGYIKIRLKKNSSSSSWVETVRSELESYTLPRIQKTVPFDTTFQFAIKSYATKRTNFSWYYHPSLMVGYEVKGYTVFINKSDTITCLVEFD